MTNIQAKQYKKFSDCRKAMMPSCKEDLVTAYLNLCTESQKVQKIAEFPRLMITSAS